MPPEPAITLVDEGFSRARGDDRDVAELARRQHGVVGRRQLVGMGLSERSIEGRIRSGRLHRLHAGVYAVGHRALKRESRWLAAVLASGPKAVLSHYSAAALWGVRPNSRGRIDVTVPHPSRSSDVIQRHFVPLRSDELTSHEGIPVTTVPRTVFDLAALSSIDQIESAIRQVEYLRLFDRLSLPDLVERYPGHRGVRRLGVALERIEGTPSGRTRSPLEERFVRFLRRHRLPLPRLNEWITVGTRRYQVDCHWPGTRQVVELDSWEAHGTRSAFREDRTRDRVLRTAGFAVTRISSAQLDDEPEAIAADLRALLTNARSEYKRM